MMAADPQPSDYDRAYERRERGMATEPTDYERGFALGEFLQADRDEGGNYDVRWDFADEAKSGTFKEFKRGFDAAFGVG